MVAEHAAGRWSTILPTSTRDQLATAVVVLSYLGRVQLGPEADAEQVAQALDDVAISCSPNRDLAVNPAKMLAIALADTNPLVWGGTVLAARAARRVAESIRRASGRTALAGDAEHLLPVIEATRQRDVFDDPFSDAPPERRPVLLLLDDGSEEPVVREHRGRLLAAAESRGVRVETIDTDAASEVACYASLLLSGTYAAEYLRVGLVEE
jgi:Bacterial phospho-glucose isomerase C-terminal SIS domain